MDCHKTDLNEIIAGLVPGARFDPFGPIDPFNNTLNRPGPNPDHLPPPGYEDMFM